jgi:phosphoribulokinase
MPGDRGDQGHLDAEIVLRQGLVHPDVAAHIGAEHRGMMLFDGNGERRLVISGDIDPAYAAEIEEAIWDRVHFASHLRSERLGEFTVGTQLHRSESLALVQLLVLYHMVTARASIALGGDGSRATQMTKTAPESEAVAR